MKGGNFMRRKLGISILVLVVLAATLVACEDFSKQAYRTMYLAGTSYDLGMKTVASLQAQGKVSPEQRANINKIANIFYASYMVGVDALKTYEMTKSSAAKDKLTIILSQIIAQWADLAALFNAVSPNLVPAKID